MTRHQVRRALQVGSLVVLVGLVVATVTLWTFKASKPLIIGSEVGEVCVRGPMDYYDIQYHLATVAMWTAFAAAVASAVAVIVFRSWWVRIPAVLVTLVLLAFGGTLAADGPVPHAGDVVMFCNPAFPDSQ